MSKLKFIGVAFLLLTLSGFADEISAYFSGEYRDEATVEKTLKDAGFEVVASYDIGRKGRFTTILFTSDELKKFASKKTRGFFAVGRVLVNDKDGEIRVANPNYFGHAFLQGDYSKDVHGVTDRLLSAFGDLKPTRDTLDKGDLEGYHFSFGMPYYEDMLTIAQGENLEGKVKSPIFSLKVGDATLIGVDLGKRTKKFTKKIGKENSLVLPYTVLVEDGKAKILDPKYYLAISYPKLSMGEFMTIATVPDAIEKDITREFH